MGRVRVRRNDLPRIIAALPGALDSGVKDSARNLRDELEPKLWRRTGVVRDTAVVVDTGPASAVVGVGEEGGHGFYAGFQEWGTSKQAARPIVGPAGHAHEPKFATDVAEAVRRVIR